MIQFDTDTPAKKTLEHLEQHNPYLLLRPGKTKNGVTIHANTHLLPLEFSRSTIRYPQELFTVLTWEQTNNTYEYKYRLYNLTDRSETRINQPSFLQRLSNKLTEWREDCVKHQFAALTQPKLTEDALTELTDRFDLLYDFYDASPQAQRTVPAITETTINKMWDTHGDDTVQTFLEDDMPLVTALCPHCNRSWEHLIPFSNPRKQAITDTLYCPHCALDTIPLEYVNYRPNTLIETM